MRKSYFFLISIVFLFNSCADLFQSKIPMGSGSNGSLDDIFAAEKEITKLESSAKVYVSDGLQKDSISVSWDPVKYAVSYCVERAVQKPGDSGYDEQNPPEEFEELSKAVYGTFYNDIVLDNPSYNNEEYGYRYWYRIYAENNRKKYEPSEPAVCEKPGTLFAPPEKVDAAKGESSEYIEIRWEKSNDANEYVVYRTKNQNGAGAEERAKIPANQTWYKDYIDASEQGEEIYYVVKAVNSQGIFSAASNIGLGYSAVEGAPQKPGSVDATRGISANEIKLTWEASAGATSGDVHYTVLRYSSVDSALTQLTADTTSCAWTDKSNVKPGIAYYYQVQAWVEDENKKKLRSQVSVVAPFDPANKICSEGFLLSPPSDIGVVVTDGGAHKILWEPAIGDKTEQEKYSYEILGSNKKSADFVPICETEPGATEFEIPESEKRDFYRVRTYYNSGLSSVESEVIAPVPFAAENLQVSKAENLKDENLYPANDSGVYPVKITWDAPSSGKPAGYHVYRSSSADSGFRKITETLVTELSYIDKNDTAKAGKRYYYRVLSLNELEQGKNYSESEFGWGALTHEQYILEFNKTILSSQKKLTLMHKPSTSALGSENYDGDISGNVDYNAKLDGLSARIIIEYTNYADLYADNNKALGPYFVLDGNSNTSANTSANGKMDGTIECLGSGMYPGKVSYDNIEIKGGDAGGGTYGVTPEGFETKYIDWKFLK